MVRLCTVPAVVLLALSCSAGTGEIVSSDGGDREDNQRYADRQAVLDLSGDLVSKDIFALPDLPAEVDLPVDFTADKAPDIPLPQCDPGEGCFLDGCTDNDACQSGWCVEHMGEGVCTMICQGECPHGWTCKPVAGGPDLTYVCVSEHSNLCKPCTTTEGCKAPGGAEDVCLEYGEEGSFCGGSCETGDDCPWGFSCTEAQTVEGTVLMQCVADAGVCPCTGKSVALALTTPCAAGNEYGVCTGKRVCTADGLSPCDALAPLAESCNGEDDDCDGDIDEPDEVDGDYVNLCDDGNSCTKDICTGVDGCAHEDKLVGECVDGDPCTAGDHCESGQCIGLPVICEDNNVCTDDFCDGLGGCSSKYNSGLCDDGDPCTVNDLCVDGECGGYAVDCQCLSDADCGILDDGNACNGELLCKTDKLPFQCVVKAGSVVLCPEPEPGPDAICRKASCAPETGACSIVADHEGFACEDGDACTVGDRCEDGNCIPGDALNCSDDNPCTSDSCDPEVGCQNVNNQASCSDGNVCTVGDVCTDGQCLAGQPLLCDDGNLCNGTETCFPDVGCQAGQPLACDDGNPCNGIEMCAPQTGCLPGVGDECNDSNPCTDDFCTAEEGCIHVPNQAPCDDSNQCTTKDHCQSGQCGYDQLLDCDDANVCTTNSCDPKSGCITKLNSAPCNDGNLCTVGDHCQLGECVGAGSLTCDDSNPCTDDLCAPGVGCTFVPNQEDCDDGTVCTLDDKCAQGWCLPGPQQECADNNPCTDNFCDPILGCQTVNNTVLCDDDDACTLGDTCGDGDCIPGPGSPDCDDSKECTQDSCDSQAGCVNTAVQNGTPCLPDGTCQDGICIPKIVDGCQTILSNSPGAGSGVYAIDPDGAGGNGPFDVYCEMGLDQGGWTLVMSINTSDGHMARLTDSIWTVHSESGDFANRWTNDYKGLAATVVDGTQLLVIVRNHDAPEGGQVRGWRSWKLDVSKSFQDFFDVSMGGACDNSTGGCNSGFSGAGHKQTNGILSSGQSAPYDTFTNQADEIYTNSYYGCCGPQQDGFRLSSHYRWGNNSNVGLGLQMDDVGDTTYTPEAGALLKKDTYQNPQRYCSSNCNSCQAYPDGSNSSGSTRAAIGSDHYNYQCSVGESYRYEWYVR